MADWNEIAQIATAAGAIIAAISLYSGYLLYRTSKRDAYATDFRLAVSTCKATARKLDSILTYELANEMAHAAVYSTDFDIFFDDAYKQLYQDTSQSEEEHQRHLKEISTNIESITVPIRTTLIRDYEAGLMAMAGAIARYETDLPAFYRVFSSVQTRFSKELYRFKKTATDEEDWGKILVECVDKDKEERGSIDSAARLRHRFAYYLTGVIGFENNEDQKDINNLIELLTLVGDAYLRRDNREIAARSRHERAISMKPMSKIETIPEDLHEAGRALGDFLTKPEMLEYVDLLRKLFPSANIDWQ